MDNEKDYRWYYFGACTPKPKRIKIGFANTPNKSFATERECQDYIYSLKKPMNAK